MKPAPIPGNDAARVAALGRAHVLDIEDTSRFDRFTRVARLVFDVPVALVSFVDRDRQYFGSFLGLERLGTRETPRDVSFCGHAILERDTMIIEDAQADPRFADNPLVTGKPGVRFYAGQPIIDSDGYPLGTLCIIDHRPRQLDKEQQLALRDLASMVEKELATTRLAMTDELTGIGNRRALLWLGAQTLDLADRADRDVTLLYFDLDGLKALNDSQGHEAGDHLLRRFAQGLERCARKSDVVCRLGGDEFAVLLSGSNEIQAERYLLAISEELDGDGAPAYSVGRIARRPRDPLDLETMLDRADAAMYEQKRRRRERG